MLFLLLLLCRSDFSGGFTNEVGELGKELVHGVTTLALVEDVGCTTLLEGGETRDRVDVFAVKDVDAVEAENVLGGWCCWGGGCGGHC